MSFSGNIKTISLAGIIQLISQEGKSGTLTVKNDDFHFQTFFLEGAIVYAIESQKASRLGQLLINNGVINETQLENCIAVSLEKKQAIGKTLTEKGLIDYKTLEHYLSIQVQEIVFSMFCLDEGTFHFKEMKLDLRWIVPIRLNTLQLVVDAQRRIDDNS